jgi:hypothetical protein
MKTYEVWVEGYRITGGSGTAILQDTVEADSFREACQKVFPMLDFSGNKPLVVWGCRLYDNEKAARKHFG